MTGQKCWRCAQPAHPLHPAPTQQVALRGEPEDPVAVPLASMDAATASAPTNGNGRGAAATRELPPLLPLDQVPQLPQVREGNWEVVDMRSSC